MANLKIGLAGKFVSMTIAIALIMQVVLSSVIIKQITKAMNEQTDNYVSQLEESRRHNEDKLKNALLAKGQLLANTVAQSAGGMILNYDFETIHDLAESAELDEEIEVVEILDIQGDAITESGSAGPSSPYLLETNIIQDNEGLGVLRLKLSPDLMEQELALLDQQISEQLAFSKEKQAKAKGRVIFFVVLISAISLLILGGLIHFIFAHLITRPLAQDMELAEEIRKGDLSKRLKMARDDEIGELANALDAMADGLAEKATLASEIAEKNLAIEVSLTSDKDQLGLALQKMTDNLNELLSQIQVAGSEIAGNASHVSASSQYLSQGAAEQASSMEQINSSIAEISSQAKQNAENAAQASRDADAAAETAERGSNHMSQMVSAMEEINRSGKDISKIIKVIDEIAFQTNLLALNAAVEAARAGRHGKGFAVVAEEVRNLSARSAKAASETSELIERSVAKAQNGSEIASATATVLEEIVEGIKKANHLVRDISAASMDQASGIDQITEGLDHIDQVTQQNTSNAEESAAAAEELSGQAAQMQSMLANFQLRSDQDEPVMIAEDERFRIE